MAENNDDLELDVKEKSGGGNNMILIIIIAVLALIIVVGGIMMMMSGGSKTAPAAAGEEVALIPEPTSKEAYYYDIRPPFVVNFHTKGRLRYLQVHVELMVRGEDVIDKIKQHLPLIKNNLVTLFSSADFENIQTYEGKEKLRERALEEVQRVMVDQTGQPGVEAVLFTSFVIQ